MGKPFPIRPSSVELRCVCVRVSTCVDWLWHELKVTQVGKLCGLRGGSFGHASQAHLQYLFIGCSLVIGLAAVNNHTPAFPFWTLSRTGVPFYLCSSLLVCVSTRQVLFMFDSVT